MKAIVMKMKNAPAQFLIYEPDKIQNHFRRFCHLAGMFYLEYEDDFDEMKIYTPLVEIYKSYQGQGVYDDEGNKKPFLKDKDEIIYYIIEYSETTDDVKPIFNIEIPQSHFYN